MYHSENLSRKVAAQNAGCVFTYNFVAPITIFPKKLHFDVEL